MEQESSERVVLKKKEKQQLKHEAFLQREHTLFSSGQSSCFAVGLESSRAPYSRSHARRLKRKAKDQLASGLQDVALALPDVEQDTIDDEQIGKEHSHVTQPDSSETPKPPRRKRKAGMIGEGKGVPLSEKQRKRVL